MLLQAGPPTHQRGQHQRAERPHLRPVHAHHQWTLLPVPPLADEPTQRPLHGLGNVDAFVAGESPGPLDAMFGGLAGAGSQTATQLGQAYPLDWQDCRDPTH
jgi:hypothetical protein